MLALTRTSDDTQRRASSLKSDRILLFYIHYVYQFHFWIGSENACVRRIYSFHERTHHHFSCVRVHTTTFDSTVGTHLITNQRSQFQMWHSGSSDTMTVCGHCICIYIRKRSKRFHIYYLSAIGHYLEHDMRSSIMNRHREIQRSIVHLEIYANAKISFLVQMRALRIFYVNLCIQIILFVSSKTVDSRHRSMGKFTPDIFGTSINLNLH